MRTENSSIATNLLNQSILVVGLGFLLFLHFFALREVPGFHYDEAWAMNYAWRIASEPGFWPWEAMSPYTAPWAHYIAALAMKVFGPSLFVFRASQVILSLGGVLFLFLGLRRVGESSASSMLPMVVALTPGLVLNHRFAIELNGFHALCFGAFCYGVLSKRFWIAALAWVFGTTAHILFYGVGFALLAALLWEGHALSRKHRFLAIAGFVFLSAFFLRVYFLIPERGKALLLLISAIAMSLLLLLQAERWTLWRKHRFEALAVFLSIIFFFNAAFFWQGVWSVALSTGAMLWKGIGGVGILFFLAVIVPLTWRGSREVPRWGRRWVLLLTICIGAMMLKPAPRYFEIVFLALSIFLAFGLAKLPNLLRLLCAGALMLHGVWIYTSYFTILPREESFRFLFFKDTSRDFLSKQILVAELGGSGCNLSDIQSVDSRVKEALVALSLRDWTVSAGGCAESPLSVQRRMEAGRAGTEKEIADFVIGKMRP